MKAELKAKWVADLRAHPELQGVGLLRDRHDKYCCLGRLREVAGLPLVHLANNLSYQTPNTYYNWYLEFTKQELVGLPNSAQSVLIQMNDGGKTFAEIADWIEANIPED